MEQNPKKKKMMTGIMSAVSTKECSILDSQIWNYKFCPHPHSNEWLILKEKMNCDNSKDLFYHCASDNHGCDVQLCLKRTYCQAGYGPLLDPSKDMATCALCPPDRFQTVGFWSNERSYCQHEKTKCDGDGQIECQPGSTMTDRSCRCNVHKNFVRESYALHNTTCCTDNDQLCYCIKDIHPCSNGTVRHDNYRCMEQCPPNYFRHWNSENCYPNSTSDPMTTTSLTASTVATPGSPGINTGMIVGIVLGPIICIIIAVLIGLYCCLKHRKKRRNKGKTRTNGHPSNGHPSNGRPRNMADMEVIDEVQDAYTLPEREATEDDGLLHPEAGPLTDDTNMTEETQEQCIPSLMSTDTQSENRPVEHEENSEQHMRELKHFPESSLEDSMEEVKPKQVWTSNDETKKKEIL